MTTHTAITLSKCQCGAITRTEWTARWFGGWEELKVGAWQWELPRTAMKTVTCRSCGEQIKKGSKRVVGKKSDQECNEKCMGATSGACECKCEGKNHGGSYAA
jgi:hypothetical protein